MKGKECSECGEVKPLDEFYKHPQMKDGRLKQCKSCKSNAVSRNRADRVDYYRKYDSERKNRKTTESGKRYRDKYPIKCKAKALVCRAIRAGNLFKEPCEKCGSEIVDAHHDDYAKPLNVRWLCRVHHCKWHKENGEGLNGK